MGNPQRSPTVDRREAGRGPDVEFQGESERAISGRLGGKALMN
jgi:hypothetical protein